MGIIKKFIKPEYLTLAALIATAVLLRLWGIDWGLPLKKAHIDESVVLFYTMRFFTGDLNPHVFFDYPTLYLYLLWLVYSAWFIAGKTMGVFGSLDSFVGIYLNGDSSSFFVIGRALSVLFAAGSIYLVYRIGKENFSEGFLPALLFSLVPVHVLHSHYSTVDVPALFFVLFAFLHFGRYYSGSGAKNLYLASFLLGLGAAVKYYPFVFLLPVWAVVVYLEKKAAVRKILLSAAASVSAFIAGCPFALLDYKAFISRFSDRLNLIVSAGPAAGSGFDLTRVLYNLKEGMTLPLLFFLLMLISIALVTGERENKKKMLLWFSFGAYYIIFLSFWKIVAAHYLLAAIPFIILSSAYALRQIRFLNRHPLQRAFLIVLLCAAPAIKTVRLNTLISYPDSRLRAHAWIKHNIPKGAKILRLPYTPEFSGADPYFVRVDWEEKSRAISPEALSSDYDFIITGTFDNKPDGWEESLAGKFTVIKQWPYIPVAPFHQPRITIYAKNA